MPFWACTVVCWNWGLEVPSPHQSEMTPAPLKGLDEDEENKIDGAWDTHTHTQQFTDNTNNCNWVPNPEGIGNLTKLV